jgi:hypothetical protein
MMSSPKALVSPQDVRSTAASVKGRLATMIAEAEAAEETSVPGFAPSELHPLIWSAAATDPFSGRRDPERPKLVWPGAPADKTVRSMRGGLEPLAKALNNLATGLNLTVRNVTTHTRHEFSEQHALERLAAYSYLARLLDECQIDRGEEPD